MPVRGCVWGIGHNMVMPLVLPARESFSIASKIMGAQTQPHEQIHHYIWQCPIECVLKALAKTSALTEVKKLAGEGGTSIIISKKSPRLALKEQR